MDDVDLRRVAVAHARDVANVDHRAVRRLDRQIAERVDRRGRVVELHRVFEAADLLRADGGDEVLRRERVRHVLSRQAARLHGDRIEVDLYLPRLAAVWVRDRGAGNGHERRADDVEADVLQLLLGHARAGQAELDDRNG